MSNIVFDLRIVTRNSVQYQYVSERVKNLLEDEFLKDLSCCNVYSDEGD